MPGIDVDLNLNTLGASSALGDFFKKADSGLSGLGEKADRAFSFEKFKTALEPAKILVEGFGTSILKLDASEEKALQGTLKLGKAGLELGQIIGGPVGAAIGGLAGAGLGYLTSQTEETTKKTEELAKAHKKQAEAARDAAVENDILAKSLASSSATTIPQATSQFESLSEEIERTAAAATKGGSDVVQMIDKLQILEAAKAGKLFEAYGLIEKEVLGGLEKINDIETPPPKSLSALKERATDVKDTLGALKKELGAVYKDLDENKKLGLSFNFEESAKKAVELTDKVDAYSKEYTKLQTDIEAASRKGAAAQKESSKEATDALAEKNDTLRDSYEVIKDVDKGLEGFTKDTLTAAEATRDHADAAEGLRRSYADTAKEIDQGILVSVERLKGSTQELHSPLLDLKSDLLDLSKQEFGNLLELGPRLGEAFGKFAKGSQDAKKEAKEAEADTLRGLSRLLTVEAGKEVGKSIDAFASGNPASGAGYLAAAAAFEAAAIATGYGAGKLQSKADSIGGGGGSSGGRGGGADGGPLVSGVDNSGTVTQAPTIVVLFNSPIPPTPEQADDFGRRLAGHLGGAAFSGLASSPEHGEHADKVLGAIRRGA